MIPQELLPSENLAAITRALGEAFGVKELEDVRRLTKGHTSSLVFRIVVRGSAYLLKIIMRRGDSTLQDHFTCMRTAVEAGSAPRVWYTSTEDQLSITDFVEAVPFFAADALVRMPQVLRDLHALPPFPARASHLNTTCTYLLNKETADSFLQRFQAGNILAKAETEGLFARLNQLAAAYPRHDSDMVSSHNDLFKPDNILFDGRKVWLVDWEAAFLNDRYADLAVVANLVVINDADEEIFLREYFGQSASEYQRARFFLMQQLAHMFYAVAFLSMGSAGGSVNLSEEAPEFNDFHRRFWDGQIELTDKQTKLAFGKVHWNRLAENLRGARFDEAWKIVADKHAA